jgi:transcription elongation factor GreA
LDRIPVTRQGFEALKKELENLKKNERPENIKAIEEARAHGDLSENAEYAAAKDRQGFIEGRINELGFKLANIDIIETDKLPKDRAVFGCKVVLEILILLKPTNSPRIGPFSAAKSFLKTSKPEKM